MRPTEKKIQNLLKNLNDQTRPELDARILNDCFTELRQGCHSERTNCHSERSEESIKTAREAVRYVEEAAEVSKTPTPVLRPNIWRILMKTKLTKPIAAAVIVVAVIVGRNQFNAKDTAKLPVKPQPIKYATTELKGPLTHRLSDGSQIKLAEGAVIKLHDRTNERGFEHVAGEIEVSVKKGNDPFIITSAFGTVKALGTVFKVDIIRVDSTDLLAVKVEEGIVEVTNEEGSKIIGENQRLTVEKDKVPYDFLQDTELPSRLIERIRKMLDAMEKGDKEAWLANFNINVLYDLAKGNIEYEQHPDWFSGMSPDDAKNFRQAMTNVNSPEQLKQIMLSGTSDETCKLYVRSVTLDKDGKHARAVCVKKQAQTIGFTPQWTFYNNDWWQTDD